MNPIDAAAAGLIGLGAALGARRGLVAQLARIVALAGGLFAARIASPEAAGAVRALWPAAGPPLDRYLAFLCVFAAIAIGIASTGAWLRERVRSGPLAPFDRAGGAVLGGAKGVLFCYVCLFVAICFPGRPLERDLRASRAAPALLEAIGLTSPLFPPEFQARGGAVRRDIEVARAAEARRLAGGEERAEACAVPLATTATATATAGRPQ